VILCAVDVGAAEGAGAGAGPEQAIISDKKNSAINVRLNWFICCLIPCSIDLPSGGWCWGLLNFHKVPPPELFDGRTFERVGVCEVARLGRRSVSHPPLLWFLPAS